MPIVMASLVVGHQVVGGIVVSITAFQAIDPGFIPGKSVGLLESNENSVCMCICLEKEIKYSKLLIIIEIK